MATASYAHIEMNADGVPVISGTRTKVLMIAADRAAGFDADAIHERYPYLSLGQVHSALAYYYDHKAEMDRALEEADRLVEEMKTSQGESPLRRTLRERGLIP